MNTLVLRISKRQVGPPPGYPLRLSLYDSTDLTAAPQEEWTALIPEAGTGAAAQQARGTLLDTVGSSDNFEKIGRYLFDLLKQGDVGAKLVELRQGITRHPPGPDFQLLLCIEDRELRALPWELLYCPETRLYPFLDRRCTVLRGPEDFSPQPIVLDWPLRVLVMIACAPDAGIGWREELQKLEQAFQQQRHWIEYDVLRHPSQALLKQEYRRLRPHVLHIIGHGMTDEEGNTYLEFWDGSVSSDNMWRWTGPQAIQDLRNALVPAPRLVFLNTCRSNQLSAQRGVFSMADSFLQAGAAAVLGMQADIRGNSAACFAASFYLHLSERQPVAVAVALARDEVAALPEVGLLQRDWALPCLLLNTLPQLLLPAAAAVSAEDQSLIDMAEELKVVNGFVDRRRERRALVSLLEQNLAEKSKGLIVTGDTEVGKTALVLLCLQGCALRGRKFHYVDLKGTGTLDFLHFLRAIRDGRCQPPGQPAPFAGESPFCRPLPPESFRRFNWELNALLEGREPSADIPPGPIADLWHKFLPDQPGSEINKETLIPRIFTSFGAALLSAAKTLGGPEPLCLVLDHLESILPEHFSRFALPLLIKKLFADSLGAIRLILVVRKQQYEVLKLETLGAVAPRLQIGSFPRAEFPALADEFVGFNPEFDLVTPGLLKRLPAEVSPRQFQRLLEGFKPLFSAQGRETR